MAATTLERIRTDAGLSQRDLAARSGTTQSLVARIESGRANPTVATLERLFAAAGFRLSIDAEALVPPDALTDAFKPDIDRTLIRGNLAKTPAQRVATLVAMGRFHDEAQRARRRSPPHR